MVTEDATMDELKDWEKDTDIDTKEQNEQLMVQFTSETGNCILICER